MQKGFVFAFLALFGSAVLADVPNLKEKSHIEPFIFENIINSTIEKIRPNLPDPLRIDTLDIVLPDDIVILTGAANISNFELTGIQSFQMTYLNFDLLATRLNFTLNLPSINLNTNYWGDLTLLDLIPLYGKGSANFHLVNAELQGSGRANLSGGISISELRIQLYLGSATFDIHGALDNEDFSSILSQVLNDVVTSFIDEHQEAITNILSPIIEGLLNAILSGGGNDTTTPPPTTTTPSPTTTPPPTTTTPPPTTTTPSPTTTPPPTTTTPSPTTTLPPTTTTPPPTTITTTVPPPTTTTASSGKSA